MDKALQRAQDLAVYRAPGPDVRRHVFRSMFHMCNAIMPLVQSQTNEDVSVNARLGDLRMSLSTRGKTGLTFSVSVIKGSSGACHYSIPIDYPIFFALLLDTVVKTDLHTYTDATPFTTILTDDASALAAQTPFAPLDPAAGHDAEFRALTADLAYGGTGAGIVSDAAYNDMKTKFRARCTDVLTSLTP